MRMISTSIHPNYVALPRKENSQQIPEFGLRLREQETLSLLKQCKNMDELKQVHAQILKWGFFWNSFCASNLVATCALSTWGSMAYACSIFEQIIDPGAFEFNTMIRGYVRDMSFEEALLLYLDMLENGVEPDNFTCPFLLKACAQLNAFEAGRQIHADTFKLGLDCDVYVQNSLINFYGKCKDIGSACDVFEQMSERSVASWSSIMAAHASLGLWHECLLLFGEMNCEGCWRPEESIIVSVLSACTHLGALRLGRCTHGSVLRNIAEVNVIVQTSLVDMYAKCGQIDKGLCLFKKMKIKNQLSYSAMISGLAMHGQGRESLKIFSEMLEEGHEPDDVVYVGVLSACSHEGLVDEGLQCFEKMRHEHRVEPTIQHYGCMVDLLGRAGKLEEALKLIESMPIKPSEIIWRSLLSACKVHHDLNKAETAARQLFQLNPSSPGDYVVLSNMYARAGRWDDVSRIRKEMAQNCIAQTPGFSLVEVGRKLHRFASQDMMHPQKDDIYEMIHQMEWQLKFEGYSPDTSQVLFDVDEEEKRERLKGHSQKLAIAFALIHTSQGSPIRITRNLRMCSDCHNYTKYISTIYNREIIVRDRNRFHRFKDGTCSCRDYW